MRLLVSALAFIPLLIADDASRIIQSMVEAGRRNAELIHDYTWIENADFKSHTETSEYIFVEGLQYKKLTARNGKPLKPDEQAKVDENLRKTALERRQARHNTLTRRTVSTGSDEDLLRWFDCRQTAEEDLDNRKVRVIECTPNASPATDKHEKEVRSFSKKFWIDQADNIAIEKIDTVIAENGTLKPGTTITYRSRKLPEGVWVPAGMILEGHLKVAKFIQPAVRTEYTYSDFRKFDVQSTITPN